MAYHIHKCKDHAECAVLVNLNNDFRTHVHTTNIIQTPPHLVENRSSFSEDDDCLDVKVN